MTTRARVQDYVATLVDVPLFLGEPAAALAENPGHAAITAHVSAWLVRVDQEIAEIEHLQARFSGRGSARARSTPPVWVDVPDDALYDDIGTWEVVSRATTKDDLEGHFAYSEDDPGVWRS